MAIAFRCAGGNGSGATAQTSYVVNQPSSPAAVQDGDVMFLFLSFVQSGTITPPAGWTSIAGPTNAASGSMRHQLFRKVAATEPSTWTFTNSVSAKWYAEVWVGSGIDTTTPEYSATITAMSGAAPFASGSVAPNVTNDAWGVYMCGADNSVSLAWSTDQTLRHTANSGSGTSNLNGGSFDTNGILSGTTTAHFTPSPLSLQGGAMASFGINAGPTVDVFTSTDTWTCPAGVTSATVRCWGGGGAGGGGSVSGAAGGGGAGGSYAESVLTVVPSTVYTVTVGAGGVADTTPSTNGATHPGDGSWFSTSGTVFAQGGAGGGDRSTSGNGTAGAGSTASSIGTVKNAGGNGAAGTASNAGAGGGGAGSTGAGNNASGTTVGAATANFGGAGGAVGAGANASDGSVYGGGGGGARATSNTDRIGGDGAPGRVEIVYTVATAVNPNAALATATGAANAPTLTLTESPAAGAATAPTAAALAPTLTLAAHPAAALATATGAANAPTLTLAASPTAGVATATATANGPTVSTAALTNASAGVATATTTALAPTLTNTSNASPGAAAATVTAISPTVTALAFVNASAGVAAATAVANDPAVTRAVNPTPGAASATAAAIGPAVTSSASVTPGVAAVTAVTQDANVTTAVAIAYFGSGSGNTNGAGDSVISVSTPASIPAGAVMVLCAGGFCLSTTPTVSGSGWTLVDSKLDAGSGTFWTWYKVADGNDGTITITTDGSELFGACAVSVFTGVDTASTVGNHDAAVWAGVTHTTVTSPTVSNSGTSTAAAVFSGAFYNGAGTHGQSTPTNMSIGIVYGDAVQASAYQFYRLNAPTGSQSYSTTSTGQLDWYGGDGLLFLNQAPGGKTVNPGTAAATVAANGPTLTLATSPGAGSAPATTDAQGVVAGIGAAAAAAGASISALAPSLTNTSNASAGLVETTADAYDVTSSEELSVEAGLAEVDVTAVSPDMESTQAPAGVAEVIAEAGDVVGSFDAFAFATPATVHITAHGAPFGIPVELIEVVASALDAVGQVAVEVSAGVAEITADVGDTTSQAESVGFPDTATAVAIVNDPATVSSSNAPTGRASVTATAVAPSLSIGIGSPATASASASVLSPSVRITGGSSAESRVLRVSLTAERTYTMPYETRTIKIGRT